VTDLIDLRDLTDLSFTWPVVLLGLAAVPVLLALYALAERRRRRSQARFGNPSLLPNVIDRAPGRLRHLPLIVLLLGLATMIVGVARPHAVVSVPREEATVILAMDTSRSMKADDIQPTRLEASREAARAFLAQIPAKFRVGVVSFSTRAAVAVPPTGDRTLVEAALDSLTPGEGTAIGDAVALSVRVGNREVPEDGVIPPRAILLISDGKQDGGTVQPDAAAAQARARGIPVYTVLVGTDAGVVEETLTGGFRVRIQVPPDPETLQALAQATGGQFYTALNDERLRLVYEQLGSRLGEREELREVTDYFAGGAALLMLLGGALSAFLFQRVP